MATPKNPARTGRGAVSNPEAQARLKRDGLIAHIMSVDELSKYIDAETARWRPVLDQLGLIGK